MSRGKYIGLIFNLHIIAVKEYIQQSKHCLSVIDLLNRNFNQFIYPYYLANEVQVAGFFSRYFFGSQRNTGAGCGAALAPQSNISKEMGMRGAGVHKLRNNLINPSGGQ